MKQFKRNIRLVIIFFLAILVFFASGLVVQQKRSVKFLSGVEGENKDTLKRRYSKAGDILSADGTKLATTLAGKRIYANDELLAKASLHIVGDYTHNISNTIEATEENALCGADRNPIDATLLLFNNKHEVGDTLTLTLKDNAQKTALKQLGDAKGAVVAMNYKTGAIVSMVSTPTTLPQNIITWEEVPDGAAFNRALHGEYLPGSTFKIITTTAWLNSPEYKPDFEAESKGKEPLFYPGGVTDRRSFGKVDLSKAFAISSNAFFGAISESIGAKSILDAANQYGYNTELNLNNLAVSSSQIVLESNDAVALQWASIGQPINKDIVVTTPLQLCLTASSIANNGVMMSPQIISKRHTPLNRQVYSLVPKVLHKSLEPKLAQSLGDLMKLCITEGTGEGAAVSGLDIRGKTGTVEVATKDGVQENSLFTGYVISDTTPYAVAIIVENAVAGRAAEIAQQMFLTLSK